MGDLFEKIIDLAKRRGFFWPSYEIYGGVSGFYDLGPYGALLKTRIIEKWRSIFVKRHQEFVVEVETPLVGPSKVYEASGHVEHFTDPIVSCSKCGRRFRADHIVEENTGTSAEGLSPQELSRLIRENGLKCPIDGGDLSEVQSFNLLFKTQVGPYEGDIGYLRPELAQGIFVAFKRIHEAMREKMPIGIAQIGRVGRNEISPRQAMIRLREFTIMEMEYFIDPEDKDNSCPYYEDLASVKMRIKPYGREAEWYTLDEAVESKVVVDKCLGYWMAVGQEFMESLGIPSNKIYFHEKGPHERAHYSAQTFDQMVEVSRWGWIEVAGHSYRGDYDLSRHMKFSGADLTVFKPYKKPVVVRKKKVIVDKKLIGKMFREEAPKVFELIGKADVEYIESSLREKGYVVLGEYRVPGEALRVTETEEKMHGRRFVPHVVEPSFGAERVLYATFEYAYREKNGRVILAFPRDVAPIHAAVFPLIEKDEDLVYESKRVYMRLTRAGFNVIYDDSGSIGRRYARADEIGVPIAFTIDYQTLEDDTITMRDRDTWEQVRIPIYSCAEILEAFLTSPRAQITDFGEPFKPEERLEE